MSQPHLSGLRCPLEEPIEQRHRMKHLLLTVSLLCFACGYIWASEAPNSGVASWYGEDHRGRLMANGKKFDPDRLTAASWFYPLGARVRVTTRNRHNQTRSVIVRITDRGPARELVNGGRIIDLTHAAFQQLASPDRGLVAVEVQRLRRSRS